MVSSVIYQICVILYSVFVCLILYAGIRYVSVFFKDREDMASRRHYRRKFLAFLLASVAVGMVLFGFDINNYNMMRQTPSSKVTELNNF